METPQIKSAFDIINAPIVSPNSNNSNSMIEMGQIFNFILPQLPKEVVFYRDQSNAKSSTAQEADVSFIAGLLNIDKGDMKLLRSIELAYANGMEVSWVTKKDESTIKAILKTKDSKIKLSKLLLDDKYLYIQEEDGLKIELPFNQPYALIKGKDLSLIKDMLTIANINFNLTSIKDNEDEILAIVLEDKDQLKEIENLVSPEIEIKIFNNQRGTEHGRNLQ